MSGAFFLRIFSLWMRGEPALTEQGGSRRPRLTGGRQSNKEVPLDAREDHFEMQRVQAEKLQHDEEQEEHPGQA